MTNVEMLKLQKMDADTLLTHNDTLYIEILSSLLHGVLRVNVANLSCVDT